MPHPRGQSTRAIHGTGVKNAHNAPHLPTYNTTTFASANTKALLDVVGRRKTGAVHTRRGHNTTTFALQDTASLIADLHQTLDTVTS